MLRSTDLYIDLGTTNTLMYIRGKGFVLNEPTYIAVKDRGHGKEVVAVGKPAKNLRGKTPDGFHVVQPLKEGVVANFDYTVQLLREFLKEVRKYSLWINPSIVMSLPSHVTPSERRAATEVALALGAKKVTLIDEPVAAAIGAGLPILRPEGHLVVDVGGGTTEIAITACGGVIHSSAIRVGGDHMDERISWHLKNKYNFLVGEQSAEQLKMGLGQVAPQAEPTFADVGGVNLLTGLPCRQRISSEQIGEAINEPVNHIVETLRSALENAPEEIAGDLADNGITLAGGGALLGGLSQRIEMETGLKTRIAHDPLMSIAMGGAQAIEDPKLLERIAIG